MAVVGVVVAIIMTITITTIPILIIEIIIVIIIVILGRRKQTKNAVSRSFPWTGRVFDCCEPRKLLIRTLKRPYDPGPGFRV